MSVIELGGEQLISARRTIPLPFTIRVSNNGQSVTLTLSKLFRVLPGKRIVALADHDGKKFVVKIYLGRTAKRYAAQEVEGVKAMSSAELLTPEMLWESRLVDGSGLVLAFHYLDNSMDLEELWEQCEENDKRLYLLRESLKILATMHNKGIQQEDIHLNNFVVKDSDIYTIDGGGMDLSGKGFPLGIGKSIMNLSRFFSQFPSPSDALIHRVVSVYEETRGWAIGRIKMKALLRKTRKRRKERRHHYVQKTLRECSRFVCESSFNRFLVCERSRYSQELKQIFADPDSAIEQAQSTNQLLKSGNSATVAMVHTNQGPIVIKRYNFKSFWHAFRRTFRQSRARTSWVNAHQLDFLGIASVKPVAIIEDKWGPFVRKAYFLSDYVEGRNADICFADTSDSAVIAQKDDIINILTALNNAMISHGDLKASNFRISPRGVAILDLDAMKEHKYKIIFNKAFDKDVKRFLKNWKANPELLDYFKKAAEPLVNPVRHS